MRHLLFVFKLFLVSIVFLTLITQIQGIICLQRSVSNLKGYTKHLPVIHPISEAVYSGSTEAFFQCIP